MPIVSSIIKSGDYSVHAGIRAAHDPKWIDPEKPIRAANVDDQIMIRGMDYLDVIDQELQMRGYSNAA